MMNYEETLEFLFTQLPMYQRVGKSAFKKDLTNTIQFAERLGQPQQAFKSIHVAGTNGKGTTSHILASILQSAGYKVGLYTSPHLKSFRERIRINGKEVSERFIVDFVNQNKGAIEEISPSFFEITVVMAFQYFAEQAVDVAVIETGLGGRLDSTNIITPILSVITSISLDHQDMLGDTLEKIAGEKAGIIKNERPVVVGSVPLEARAVMEDVASIRESKMYGPMRVSQAHLSANTDLSEEVLKLNLGTILRVIDLLPQNGLEITEDQLMYGIAHVTTQTGLKGRWQKLKEKPFVVCDVGHNEEAVTWLMNQISELTYQKLHIVWGMVADKSIEKILLLLIKDAEYYFCAADVPRALSANELADRARRFGCVGEVYDSVDQAYQQALSNAKPGDLIFVGGSTFVVAELRDL